MRVLLILLFFITCFPVLSQTGPAKRALRALADNDLEKARELIIKGLERDSTDPMIYYNIARLQTVKNSQAPDSANITARKARLLYDSLATDEKEKYAKSGLTGVSLDLLRRDIDSLAFARAADLDTEAAYNYFLSNYPEAEQRLDAVDRRNFIAFKSAKTENTYTSYRNFLDKYPDAPQASAAEERYERLFFEESTADGRLESFEEFLQRHPSTPYREEVEYTIFQMHSSFPQPEILEMLIDRFRGRDVSRHARNFLFYQEENPGRYWTDSLRSARQKNSELWVATYQEDRVIFVDQAGNQKFSIDGDMLSEQYRCKVLTTDVIIGSSSIYSRQGDAIVRGDFDDAEPLGRGYIRISKSGLNGLITSWGLEILPVAYEEIQILPSNLIIARLNRKWQLFTYTGRPLTKAAYRAIQYIDQVHIVQRGEQEGILSQSWIERRNRGLTVPELTYYDDYEIVSKGRIWVRRGDHEFIVNPEGEALIEPDFQRVEALLPGYLIRRPGETVVRDSALLQKYSTREKLIDFNDYYARFTSSGTEGLFDLNAFRFVALPDSAEIAGTSGVIAFLNNSISVYQYGKEMIKLNEDISKWQVVQAPTTEWIILYDRYPRLVTETGLLRMPAFESISAPTDSLFILEINGKRSLLHANGEELLPPRYDGIGNFDGRDLSLLRNGKFGVYRTDTDLRIAPKYEKLLKPYGDDHFIAVEDGKKGLINMSGEEAVPFSYDDIFYWQDTVALVSENGRFGFHEIGGEFREDNVLTSVSFLKDTDEERIIMGFYDRHFGIFSSDRGEVLAPEFDDIINIGTVETPVYFTETYVDQAKLHVVVYYDAYGNILRRQAMEPEFFSEVLCEE